MTVLERIVERTRRDVEARKTELPPPNSSDRSFLNALAKPGLSLIAEIKRRSPSRGALRADVDPREIASIYDRHASAISVLTDQPHFGGSFEDLVAAKAASRIPILCKDFVVDPWQIIEARHHGANAILLMASVLPADQIEHCLSVLRSVGMHALVEVHSAEELDIVLSETSAEIVGINSRNLHTLEIDERVIFDLAPKARAAGKVVVAESGVHTPEQVARLKEIADAVLIGSSLMLSPDIEAKLESLGW